jgi:hypothetical protein
VNCARRSLFRFPSGAQPGKVFDLLREGRIQAQVAARLPLHDAAAAMRLAESGTVAGKVVLIPAGPPPELRSPTYRVPPRAASPNEPGC